MIKLIIFDWDDVFTLGSKEGYIACLHETLIELNVHLDPEEEHLRILSTWSQPHRAELQNLLREHPEMLDKACEIYEKKFFGNTFVNGLSYIQGTNDLLKRLAAKYILTVATGANPIILRESVIPKFAIPNVFAQIISTYDIDDPAKYKPHPYMAQEILRQQNIKPNEAILVGDAKTDVQLARNAGIEPVVVLTGHLNRQQAEDLKVKYIIEDVTKLEQILEVM